jgi:hypothetical protein
MFLDVAAVAVFLAIGNIAFRHFEPLMPWWRRALKTCAILGVTAAISYYFGRTGVVVGFAVAMLPVLYIHALCLPRHGVNGWTGEPPREVLRFARVGASAGPLRSSSPNQSGPGTRCTGYRLMLPVVFPAASVIVTDA